MIDEEEKHSVLNIEAAGLIDEFCKARVDEKERDGRVDSDYSSHIWSWGEERLFVDMIKTLAEIAGGQCTCGDDLIDMARQCLDPNRKLWPRQPGSR